MEFRISKYSNNNNNNGSKEYKQDKEETRKVPWHKWNVSLDKLNSKIQIILLIDNNKTINLKKAKFKAARKEGTSN